MVIDGPAGHPDFRFGCQFCLKEVKGEPRISVVEQNVWTGGYLPLQDDAPYVAYSVPSPTTITFHGWYCVRNEHQNEVSQYLTDATIGPEAFNTMKSLVEEARAAIEEDRKPRFFKAWKIATGQRGYCSNGNA